MAKPWEQEWQRGEPVVALSEPAAKKPWEQDWSASEVKGRFEGMSPREAANELVMSGPRKKPEGEQTGFWANLEDADKLWLEQSLPAHLYQAYQKGVFEKAIGEFSAGTERGGGMSGGVARAALSLMAKEDSVSQFSLKALFEEAKKDPGKFGAALANALIADPYLLFIPSGLGGAVATRMATLGAKVGPTTAKLAAATGRMAETGVVAAGAIGGLSAAEQLARTGEISPTEVGDAMKGGAMFAPLGALGKTKMPGELVKPVVIPEMGPSAVKGASLADQLNQRFGIKSPEELATLKTERYQDILDAFKMDKDYADWLRYGAEEKAGQQELKPSERGELPTAGGRATKLALGGVALTGAALSPEVRDNLAASMGMIMAVKGKGGAWLPRAREFMASPLAVSAEADSAAVSIATRSWANSASSNYLNKWAGTADDPLRNIEIPYGIGTKPWGAVIDSIISGKTPEELMQISGIGPNSYILEGAPLGKKLYSISEVITPKAQALRSYLAHVGDYLSRYVPIEKLKDYGFVRAVKETAEWDKRLVAQMKEAKASNAGTTVYKDYPDGMKWVEVGKVDPTVPLPKNIEIKQTSNGWQIYYDKKHLKVKEGNEASDIFRPIGPKDNISLFSTKSEAEAVARTIIAEEALQNEGKVMGHCVGGYCDKVFSGESRIFSLRDKSGESHVTVEVVPQYILKLGAEPVLDIGQIKGKQNRAPVDKYIPYVQDFIKSGKWGGVGDLYNTGLFSLGGKFLNRAEAEAEIIARSPKFEVAKWNDDAIQVHLSNLHFFKRPPNQAGFADPKLLARLSAIGLGATAGAFLDEDNPFEGAVLGSLAAGGLTAMSPRVLARKVKEAWQLDKRVKIEQLGDAHEVATKTAALAVWRLQNNIIELVPKAERRQAVTHWLEGDKAIELSKPEMKAALMSREFFNEMKLQGMESGVLKSALENYVTHLWDLKGNQSLESLLTSIERSTSMSPNSRFAKARTIPTIAVGKKPIGEGGWGLTPITEDIADILGIYGNSMSRSIANKKFIESLKNEKLPSGENLLLPVDKAPSTYSSLPHPQLQGMRIHPDIIPSLKFFFENKSPNTAATAIFGINTAAKRVLVSFSLFHAKALTDAYIGAAKGGPIAAAKDVPKFLGGEHVLLKQLRESGAGDLIDLSIKGGLMYSLERGPLAVEDVGQSFYGMLKDAQKVADQLIPGTGKVVKGYEKVNHLVDKYMWERLHAGMKLQIFSEKLERLGQVNAKAHERNPQIPLKSRVELAKISAEFTNEIFGGLNWRRLAEGAKTKWGRDLAMAAYSPSGRRAMQLFMFAPDWTISTTGAALKAFGKGSGLGGIVRPQTVADLHRQYILRSALYYTVVGSALNMAFSGKPIWENADPTYIDMGDGRKMQWSKHTMEPVHWLTNTRQQALNKLSQVIKIPAEQLMNVEYLSAGGHAPSIGEGERLRHIAKSLSPIAVQQQFDTEAGSGIAGFLGSPIYGKTETQRRVETMKRDLKKARSLPKEARR